MTDRSLRLALERHWEASDAGDFEAEHDIYHEDAVLHYPQSGERIRGRRNIRESRYLQPNRKRFTVNRIVGDGDLWVTEFMLSYDGIPSYAVSIMEFDKGLVARETQYFADPFEPAASRAHLVDPAAPALLPDRRSDADPGYQRGLRIKPRPVGTTNLVRCVPPVSPPAVSMPEYGIYCRRSRPSEPARASCIHRH